LNDNIEKLNVNIQGQQKHHDEEMQKVKSLLDEIELSKKPIKKNTRNKKEEIEK